MANTLNYRQIIKVLGALLGFVGAASCVWIETLVLLQRRTDGLSMASKGTLTTTTPRGECVGYADPSSVGDLYGDGAKTNRVTPWLFGIPIKVGGRSVDCKNGDAKEQLSRLVAASVHALRWNAHNGGSDAVRWAYEASASAAVGLIVPLNYSAAVQALSELSAPPKACSDIYGGDPAPELGVAPATMVALSCDSTRQAFTEPGNGTLLRHCIDQFRLGQYAPDVDPYTFTWYESGTGGTLGLPVYGQPLDLPLPVATSAGLTNSSQPWDVRARVLYGYRFGLGVFSAAPGITVACFLLFDTLFLLIAEMTETWRMRAIAAGTSPDERADQGALKALIKLKAGMKAMRKERYFAAIFGWIALVIFRIVFAWTPFAVGEYLPLPECERGGWKLDYETTNLEFVSVWVLAASIFVVPFSRRPFWQRLVSTRVGSFKRPVQYTPPLDREITRTRQMLAVVVFAAVLLFFAQGTTAYVFGEAFAERVAEVNSRDAWDAEKYASILYGKVVGVVAVSVSVGTCGAVVLARWLFQGRTFAACLTLLAWFAIAALAFLPLILVEAATFEADEFSRDCGQLEGFAETACRLRFGGFVAGIILLAVPTVMLCAFCGWRNLFTMCRPVYYTQITTDHQMYDAVRTMSGELPIRASQAPGIAPALYFGNPGAPE